MKKIHRQVIYYMNDTLRKDMDIKMMNSVNEYIRDRMSINMQSTLLDVIYYDVFTNVKDNIEKTLCDSEKIKLAANNKS